MNRLLLRKAFRDLGRRRSQIVAVAVTVFIGIGMFAANNDAAGNLAASYQELYDRLEFADVWASGDDAAGLADHLAADPDVTAVTTRTRIDASLRIGDRQLRGTVIGMPTDGEPATNRLLVLEGDGLSATPDEVVVEQHGWDEFGLAAGDTVEVFGANGWHPLSVVGGAASAEYVWLAPSRQQVFTVPDEFAVLFVSEETIRSLAPEAPLQVTAAVADHDPAAASRLAAELGELGAADAYTRAEQASNVALQGDVTGFQQLSFLFPVLFLTVAGMAAFVLLSRLVRIERQQIGMMVANGMSVSTIRWHYTSHAVVAVFAGAIPGLIAGALLGRWISGLYTDFVDVPITVIRFSPATILWSLGFSVLVALLAGGLPARAAAGIQPAAAMRPVAPAGRAHRSLIERVWPGRPPAWVRMAARNVTRSPRRFVSTVLGVVLAMILLVTSLGMSDTIFAMVDRAFSDVDRRDVTVTYDTEIGSRQLDDLVGRPEVAGAERFAETPAVVAVDGATTDQLLQAFEPDTAAHGFDVPLADSGLVLGSYGRRELGVEVGDPITLTLPGERGATIETVVAGFVDEPIPSVSYVSIDQWSAWGLPVDTAVVTLVDRDTHRAVRDDLQAAPGVVAVVDQQATVQALESLMGLTYVFVGLMVAFALVMAIALVYNMVSVSLAERTGEVAVLQANGIGRRFVRRTVSAEHLVTIIAGVIPGTLVGWVLARAFMAQFETESFSFEFVLHPRSIVLAVVLVLAGALVAQWPGLRSLDRLDLAAVVRERSE